MPALGRFCTMNGRYGAGQVATPQSGPSAFTIGHEATLPKRVKSGRSILNMQIQAQAITTATPLAVPWNVGLGGIFCPLKLFITDFNCTDVSSVFNCPIGRSVSVFVKVHSILFRRQVNSSLTKIDMRLGGEVDARIPLSLLLFEPTLIQKYALLEQKRRNDFPTLLRFGNSILNENFIENRRFEALISCHQRVMDFVCADLHIFHRS